MPDYRAYAEGHFIRAEFLHSLADDATAIKADEQLVDGHDVELWDRDRMPPLGVKPRWTILFLE